MLYEDVSSIVIRAKSKSNLKFLGGSDLNWKLVITVCLTMGGGLNVNILVQGIAYALTSILSSKYAEVTPVGPKLRILFFPESV